MNKKMLRWDETLFKDPDVFELSYVPEQFSFRSDQTDSLSFSIHPAFHGGRILDTVCRGPPATGKTTSVKKIFEVVRNLTDKVVPIYVNCKIDSTQYAVFSRVFSELTKLRIPPSGTSLKQILDQTAQYLLAEKVQPLVCLDDANYLIYEKEFINVIYPFVRLHEAFPELNIGMIVIISDPLVDVFENLDVRTRSTFHPEVIEYPPYTANEIASILGDRVKAGLYPRVFSPELLDKVVEICMHYEDVRFGLDIIKRSVLTAERDARRSVTEEDVDKVIGTMMNVRIFDRIRSLAPDEFLVLRTIVEMLAERDTVSTKELEQELALYGPKKSRLAEIILELVKVGLIEQKYVNAGSGRRRFISLHGSRYDIETCVRSLSHKPENK
ncbi:MAG TPA: ORC1-type DNA replication protein [Methanocorpusculum sp.]|nr:ORC1-type DNA replication protein [Methanocorpusculum sp.]